MGGVQDLWDLLAFWGQGRSRLSRQAIRCGLGRLRLSREDVSDRVDFGDDAYRRVVIGRGTDFETLLLCWRSGQRSPIHDHNGSTCGVLVIDGTATETIYRPSPCGRIVPWRSRRLVAGSVTVSSDADIHQVGNLAASGHDLITLHIYSPPLSRMRVYSIDETTLADPGRQAATRPRDPTREIRVDTAHLVPSGTPGRSGGVARPSPAPGPEVVAVIGGGFSGTMVAVNLARQAGDRPLRVVLFERGTRFARGVAYGTTCDRHLLNVPAGAMSALVDEPDDFLGWLRTRDPRAHAGTFAPRALYGEYLEELLARASAIGGATIEPVRDEVVDLRPDESGAGVVVVGRGGEGEGLLANRVVIATGNPAPEDVLECPDELRDSRRYLGNSWERGVLEGLGRDDPLVLIGSGLSAVDVVVEARAAGLAGTITVVSRHGLLPQRHRTVALRAVALPAIRGDGVLFPTPRNLLRHLRREATRCEREGGDWRQAVDALRPSIPAIWRAFSLDERRRFIRHLGSRWDVHRHRVAPEIDRVLEDARREGQLRIVAGRVRSLAGSGDGVEVTMVRRGAGETEALFARRVINCTGPSRSLRPGRSALVDALIDRGVGRPDPLALGLEATEDGALVDRDGTPSRHVFALGPILKGKLWETTAVRELRVQAHDLARYLLATGRPLEAGPGPVVRDPIGKGA